MSIEVSPLLAQDTAATVKEAKRLHAKLARPNVMIKVPATPEGLPAIRGADLGRHQRQRDPDLLGGGLRAGGREPI